MQHQVKVDKIARKGVRSVKMLEKLKTPNPKHRCIPCHQLVECDICENQ